MKRTLLRILLVMAGLLSLFRFGGPALFFGATGPGPFDNRWLSEAATPTLLLDADLRFFGAIMLGVGVIFFWAIWRIEALSSVIYVLACAIGLGAASRIYPLISHGNPGTAGIVPIVIEAITPILLILLLYYIEKDAKKGVHK